jgi:hypothetical protein
VPFQPADAGHGRDLDAAPHEVSHIGHGVGAAGVGREIPRGRHELDRDALVGEKLSANERRMAAVFVDDKNVSERPEVARQNVPTRLRQFATKADRVILRQSAGRDYDDVWRQRQDVARFGVGVEAELDAEPFAFGNGFISGSPSAFATSRICWPSVGSRSPTKPCAAG